jgi:hypothetical protein
MANLVVNTLRVTGPVEDRERLKAAIEACAVDGGEGVQCLKEYHLDWEKWRAAFFDWGDVTVFGTIESCYSYEHLNRDGIRPMSLTKDDGRPVRTVEDVLIVKTVTRWDPPIDFVGRLGEVLPRLEVDCSSLNLSGSFTRWRSRAGETEILERQSSPFTYEGIFNWEKQGKVWQWVGEREADIETMWEFLKLECAGQTDELRTACRLAYDVLTLPGTALGTLENGYAYSLACTIAEYRHALILRGAIPWRRAADQPEGSGPQKAEMAEDDKAEGQQ